MFWFENRDAIERTEFTPIQCYSAAKKIERLLGDEWLVKQLKYLQPERHPIARMWQQTGVSSILEFLVLANDLEILEGIKGFKWLLEDLKDTKRYEASKHEAHIADKLN